MSPVKQTVASGAVPVGTPEDYMGRPDPGEMTAACSPLVNISPETNEDCGQRALFGRASCSIHSGKDHRR